MIQLLNFCVILSNCGFYMIFFFNLLNYEEIPYEYGAFKFVIICTKGKSFLDKEVLKLRWCPKKGLSWHCAALHFAVAISVWARWILTIYVEFLPGWRWWLLASLAALQLPSVVAGQLWCFMAGPWRACGHTARQAAAARLPLAQACVVETRTNPFIAGEYTDPPLSSIWLLYHMANTDFSS